MKITVKQLVAGMPYLNLLSNPEVCKLTPALKFRLAPLMVDASEQIQAFETANAGLLEQYGEVKKDAEGNAEIIRIPGQPERAVYNISAENRAPYDAAIKELCAEEIELRGRTIKIDELQAAIGTNGSDISSVHMFVALDWLIVED